MATGALLLHLSRRKQHKGDSSPLAVPSDGICEGQGRAAGKRGKRSPPPLPLPVVRFAIVGVPVSSVSSVVPGVGEEREGGRVGDERFFSFLA